MPHYLKHHFDPEFDFRNLRPGELRDGSVDHRNMGYVRNVLVKAVAAHGQGGPQPGT